MWCIGQITGEYLARMENVLSLYHLPYNERRPVICLDELPFQMLGEKVEPIKMKAARLERLIMNMSEAVSLQYLLPLSL